LRCVGCTLLDVPVRTGEPSDAAFIVEMARLATAIEGRPLPPLDALAARAAEHGYDRLALNVHICNPAVRLYSRAGFVVAGEGARSARAMVRYLPCADHVVYDLPPSTRLA
jgi:hypothetical protein